MESNRTVPLVYTLNACEDTENNKEVRRSSIEEETLDNSGRSCINECGLSLLSLCQDIDSDNLQPYEDITNSLPIVCLPEVVLVNVMEYLSLKDRYHLSLTCKLFYNLFSHPQLWQVAHISLFTQGNQERSSHRWRLKSVMHQTMVEIVQRFSHLFQHLSLEMFRYVQPFDENCRKMLENLNKDCRLESLVIRLGALVPNDEYVQRTSAQISNFNDVPLIVGLIRSAVRLKRLSIISWPLHWEVEDSNNIFEALLRNEKIKGLELLSIFYIEVKCESWTERNPKLPSIETTFELVSHFRSLTCLALRSPMLNNEIIMELASRKRSKLCLFQILIVYSKDSAFHEGYKVPDISSKAWKTLKLSSPELKVEYLVITRIPPEQLNIMMKPEVPLSALTILNYGRCDNELIENLVEMYKGSFEKFVCLCDSTGDNCDQALVNLVLNCEYLQNLTYHGSISHETIIVLAEIVKRKRNKLNSFEFKEKNITTFNFARGGSNDDVVVAKDSEEDEYYLVGLRAWHQDEDEHKLKLNLMAEHVSHALGHRWQPLA